MNLNSNAAATTGTPLTLPCITINASFSAVAFCACVIRSLYFFKSLNLSTSTGCRFSPISTRPSSSRNLSKRQRAPTRACCSHFGQTSKLRSISARYNTAPQALHLVHKPSGTLLRDSPSIRIRSGNNLVNQFIEKPYLVFIYAAQLTCI